MKPAFVYYDGWHQLSQKWLARIRRGFALSSRHRARKRRAELARRKKRADVETVVRGVAAFLVKHNSRLLERDGRDFVALVRRSL